MNKKSMVVFLKRLKIYFLIDFLRQIRFFRFRFHHPYIKVGYNPGQVVVEARDELREIEFIRLARAVKASADYTPTSQWKEYFGDYHSEVVEHLHNENFIQLESMLSDPRSNNLMYGFDNLCESLQSSLRLETRTESAMTADHFLALAEFLGVTNYLGPEGLVSPKKKFVDVNPLIEGIIRKVFQREISLPNLYPGETGIVTPFGIASLRVPAAIYQANQVVKLGTNICEIGPGLGRTAYFANLIGVKKYTLVDIPIASLCQGYFLLNSLPNVEFSVCGESDIDRGIQLRLPAEFLNSSEKYDVVLNCDSLTEIGIDPAREYIKKIIASAKFFLSINHEGNEFTIRELAAEFGELKLISRNRSWVRSGYVEELYEISN